MDKATIRRIAHRIRFGKITSRIDDTINNIPCEITYFGRCGEVIGFWAYGSFDPSLPYRGDE